MAAAMNKVILVGRMGEDPKLSYTTSGTAVTSFSLATDEGYRDRQSGNKIDKVEWHSIVLWRGQAEFAANYLSKGRLVLVEGKLQTRKWQAQDGTNRYKTEIVANNIQALDNKGMQDGAQQGGYQKQYNNNNQQQGGYQQQNNQQQPPQQQYNSQAQPPQQGGAPAPEEDLGPAFPSEASGMDDVPF
ncbi:MAG: single-stranded DNA-binding protein [Desulfovibrio sp.]